MRKKPVPASMVAGEHLMVVTISVDKSGHLEYHSWNDTDAPEFVQLLARVLPPLVEVAIEETAAECNNTLIPLHPLINHIVKG